MWPEREAAYLLHFSPMFSRPSAAAQRTFVILNVRTLIWLGDRLCRQAIEYQGFPRNKSAGTWIWLLSFICYRG